MCLWLEAAGLMEAVDVIYGCSTGALNGCYTAAGQASIGSTNYEDTAYRGFRNFGRLLRGRPVIDLEFLFDTVLRDRKPLSWEAFVSGPPVYVVTVDVDLSEVAAVSNFLDVDELLTAVRASCALPVLAGAPIQFRGRTLVDGGLRESMPFASAIAGGATDVLVLRTRAASYRKDPYPRVAIETVRRLARPTVATLVAGRPSLYNAEAATLEAAGPHDPYHQIAPCELAERIPQTTTSPQVIRGGIAQGVNAAASAFGVKSAAVVWQPMIYNEGL
jgi:predicted patatin/cPLA2 family phospholipase